MTGCVTVGFVDARKGTAGAVRHGELWLVLFRRCEVRQAWKGKLGNVEEALGMAWIIIIKEAKGKNNERIQMENRIL